MTLRSTARERRVTKRHHEFLMHRRSSMSRSSPKSHPYSHTTHDDIDQARSINFARLRRSLSPRFKRLAEQSRAWQEQQKNMVPRTMTAAEIDDLAADMSGPMQSTPEPEK